MKPIKDKCCVYAPTDRSLAHLFSKNAALDAMPSGKDPTLFGLAAVSAMLLFYALEDRSPWYVLAFAGACGLASCMVFIVATS